jgi:hypothetical protein
MSYDPAVGRWLQQDPEEFDAGDANLYRYIGNDPVNATDPSGLFDEPDDGSRKYSAKKMLSPFLGTIELATFPVRPARSSVYAPPEVSQPIVDEHLDPKLLMNTICKEDQKDSAMRGCVGLTTTRLGYSEDLLAPQTLPNTRAFTSFEVAKAYQKQLDSNNKGKNGKAVLFAVDSYGKLTPVADGLPSEVSPNFDHDPRSKEYPKGRGFDYLTELNLPDGTPVWEHANHTFKQAGGFVIHTYLTKPADLDKSDIEQGKTRAYLVHLSQSPQLTPVIPPSPPPISAFHP